MEVKDFEGAVKMQGAMMDKLASSRLFRITKIYKQTKNNQAFPSSQVVQSLHIDCFEGLRTERKRGRRRR